MLQSLRILGTFVRLSAAAPARTDEPIRAEIYSAERLELHAESLAARQPVYESYWDWYDLAAEARRNGTHPARMSFRHRGSRA